MMGKWLMISLKAKQVGLQGKILLWFHLLGQHIGASDRFPHTKQFCKFSYKDINRNESYMTKEKKQDIADYDNATLYNDYVIRKIVEPYMDKPTVMVYFSDHGQARIDGKYIHGDYKEASEVPYFIWFSDKIDSKKKGTEVLELTSTSTLYSNVLNLMGVKNPKTTDNTGKFLKLDLKSINYKDLE